MDDFHTYWIAVANIALAVVVIMGILAVAGGMAHELIVRWKKRREISAELDAYCQRLFVNSLPASRQGGFKPSDAYGWRLPSN